jgi:hypothetical protein
MTYQEALTEHGTKAQAARHLGIPVTTFKGRLDAELAGRVPFVATHKSTLTDMRTGQTVLEWVKSSAARDSHTKAICDAIEGLQLPERKIGAPKASNLEYDVVPWVIIGDGHIGMLAHEAETGANFDIKIGVREICAAADGLIDQAPDCERMVIEDVGDLSHYENFAGVTEASGHALDFDSRFPKMVDALIEVMCYIIDRALEKAQTVDFIASQGNHSRTNDIWMARLIRKLYGHTGRVNVLNNDSPLICYRMGKTLVLCHHGDKMKPATLAGVMQSDFAVDWGETEFRYIDGGHVHHSSRKEMAGCRHESFNNLAPRDKYANDGGWRSRQSMNLVLRSRTYGETGRITMPVEKVRDMIRANPATADHYVPPVMRAFAA